jgi:putative phosphoribosyl transferase
VARPARPWYHRGMRIAADERVHLPFADRAEAGRALAQVLRRVALDDPLVVGLPRGGVPVAAPVADALGAPLDVIIVRKLGTPGHRELAMGAVGEGGIVVEDERVRRAVRPSPAAVERIVAEEQAEVVARARRFRAGRQPHPLAGRTVVVVDDGLATGSTAEAAVRVAKAQGAARVVLAVPVGSDSAVHRLEAVADDVLCLAVPSGFGAVGAYYHDFSQTSDEEVVRLLAERPDGPDRGAGPEVTGVEEEVAVEVGPGALPGTLAVPPGASGVVVFAHGSGSSRHSSRNQQVARQLRQGGLGTLLFDLLLPDEASDRSMVFDIDLLATRLIGAVEHVRAHPVVGRLPVGCFGASTGGGAALVAAARRPGLVGAVVSRGGRPDLAGERLGEVRAPTRLIVGGSDVQVLELNRAAAARLVCEHDLVVVPGATHLFEEPGALDEVARLAVDWFAEHLRGPGPDR